MKERLKQRLVGAIVLVSLAVVLVPVLFETPLEMGEQPYTAPIPERPQGAFESPVSADRGAPETSQLDVVPEGERGSRGRDSTTADRGERSAAAESGDPVVTVIVRSPESAPQPTVDLQPEPALAPADPFPPARTPGGASAGMTSQAPVPESDGWTVQLGSFAKSGNAHALRDRLRSKGYDAFVVSGASAQGAMYRVFVGSALDREQAGRSAARLLREMQLEGIVVRQAGG